ncbi:TniQ family protein [Streptomyces lincolnensis]|uniref:TniQ family protein n=1 Tax=Streptomyces lincolnensis TaxID=1915 RepID=UPI001E44D209|nr:TniQ family protein [Streptomyces lincolnensis]
MDLTGLLGPSRPLPVQVRPVGGESTGSFVRRLGRANGLNLASFLERVGQGEASQDPEQVEKYPQYTEMKMNVAGRTYLSVLSGLEVGLLQWALPSLADDLLLPGRGPAMWQWPWEAEGGHLVPWCTLCGHRRQVGERVWLMSADGWQLCGRHLRWTDDSRSTDPEAVSVAALPECVAAHQGRLRLQSRFKAAGDELFADACQVMYRWWRYAPDTLVWVQRAWAAGLEARSARAVPLVVFPEAVKLAWLMLRFEQAGLRTPQDRGRWLVRVQHQADLWDVDFAAGKAALLQWLERHSSPAATDGEATMAGRRWLPLAERHNRIASRAGSLEQRSCMPAA